MSGLVGNLDCWLHHGTAYLVLSSCIAFIVFKYSYNCLWLTVEIPNNQKEGDVKVN